VLLVKPCISDVGLVASSFNELSAGRRGACVRTRDRSADNGNAADIKQRVALKILGRSSVERQIAFAQERGWRDLNFVQAVGDDYANDLGILKADGSESPALVVFKRNKDTVRLFWASEMRLEMADPGQDPREAPDIA